MTTVREAAIANGWDPAEGSPWVGPDGVTYFNKQAFYDAQTTTTCPSWCTINHTAQDEGCHTFSVLSELFAGVGVDSEERTGVRIFVDLPYATLSVEEAARVAAALTEAVRLAGTPSYSTAEVAHILGVSLDTVEALTEAVRLAQVTR